MTRKNDIQMNRVRNPEELSRGKRGLMINPTTAPQRSEPELCHFIVYEYTKESSCVWKLHKAEECFEFLYKPENSWINIDGLRKDVVDNICAHYGIHQLIAEDILSIGQRPKMDEIGGVLFCLLYMLYFNEATSSVEVEQISLILGDKFLISFQEDETRDVFDGLREKLKINNSKVRQHETDFLFYALIDSIVDNYFLVLEKLGEKIETLEEDVIRRANKMSLARINNLRKEMIVLKRNIAPVRDLVSGILKSENSLLNERTEKYFKDVYDHILQANDLADNYRDMLMNLQDLYLGHVNLKLNEVMKVMAVVTCLLAPATVIGGIFGMNFDIIPLLHNDLGFYISVGAMLMIPVWMYFLFKRRGWF